MISSQASEDSVVSGQASEERFNLVVEYSPSAMLIVNDLD